MIKKQNQIFFTALVSSDILMLLAAWLAAFEIRFRTQIIPVRHGIPDMVEYLYVLPFILAAFPLSAHLAGLYKPFGGRRVLTEIYYAAKTVALITVFILCATFFARQFYYSRVVMVYFGITGTSLLALSHVLSWKVLVRYRAKEEYLKDTLIIGAGDLGRSLAEKIDFHPELGFLVQGFIDVDPDALEEAKNGKYPLLGGLRDLRRLIGEYEIDQVFIALPAKWYGKMEEILEALSEEMVDIKVVPDIVRTMRLNAGVEEFEGYPIINLVASPMVGWNGVAKRCFDVVFGVLCLAIFSPLLLLIAAAVKGTSRGPIFYSQERMGLDGRRFMMYKFRSMFQGAERDSGPKFSEKDDSRVTAVGKILRRLSLDELPQLFNVVKGEMSLVGPRPERPVFVEGFREKIPRYMQRHKMKAGMTGWAQVNDWRGNTSIDKRIEYDLYYIEHWSILFDLKILIYTAWKVFSSKNAY